MITAPDAVHLSRGALAVICMFRMAALGRSLPVMFAKGRVKSRADGWLGRMQMGDQVSVIARASAELEKWLEPAASSASLRAPFAQGRYLGQITQKAT